MSQTRVLTIERPHDYLYDKIYQLSGERDHARATIAAAATSQQIVAQPNYDAMFSELKQYPRAHYVMNNKDMVPRSVNRYWSGFKLGVTEFADVGGRDRFRYFRRPVVPYATQLPPDVILAAAEPQNLVSFISEELSAGVGGRELDNIFNGTRTIATQTLFRDSEVQTDPYSPDYVIRPGEMPEVLTLASLNYGHGLPPGLHEVEMIERARHRRELEAQLPPLEDLSQAEKRMKMMDAIEREEWRIRESQIEELQRLRLGVLVKLLKHREEAHQELSNQRLDRLWNKKQRDKEKYFHNLRLKHVKALRQLIKRFKNVENRYQRRDIISEYNNCGSQTWAPLTRIGQFIDRNNRDPIVNSSFLTTYEGLCELEQTLPGFVLNPRINMPKRVETTKAGFKKRKYREEEKLSVLYESIKTAIATKDEPEKPLQFLEKIEKPIPRPPTPTIEEPDAMEEDTEKAVIFLQQLVRGKSVQSMMFEGKEKRKMLIEEMRSTHSLLTHELEVNRKDKADTLNLQRQRLLLDHREEKINEELAALQGQSISGVFDYLSKELIRLQEERKMHAIFMRAERERRIREAEESGLRQLEERRRREQDEIFKQVIKMNQTSVDKYLEEIIESSTKITAEEMAGYEIEEMALKMNQQAYENEKTNTLLQQEEIVGDLIHNFLIPEVYKLSMKERVEKNQHKFLVAAHKEIVGTADDVTTISASERCVETQDATVEAVEEKADNYDASQTNKSDEVDVMPITDMESNVTEAKNENEEIDKEKECKESISQLEDEDINPTMETADETQNYNEADDTTIQDFSEMMNEDLIENRGNRKDKEDVNEVIKDVEVSEKEEENIGEEGNSGDDDNLDKGDNEEGNETSNIMQTDNEETITDKTSENNKAE